MYQWCRLSQAPGTPFFPSGTNLFMGGGPQVRPASLVSCLHHPGNCDAAQCAGRAYGLPARRLHRLRGLLDQLQEAHVCQPAPSHGSVGDGEGVGALYGVVVFRDDQWKEPLEEPLWVFLVAREIFRILEGLSGNSLKVLGGSFLELCAAYEATGVALCLGRRVLHLAKPQSAS